MISGLAEGTFTLNWVELRKELKVGLVFGIPLPVS
jgi:hypothetical protein